MDVGLLGLGGDIRALLSAVVVICLCFMKLQDVCQPLRALTLTSTCRGGIIFERFPDILLIRGLVSVGDHFMKVSDFTFASEHKSRITSTR